MSPLGLRSTVNIPVYKVLLFQVCLIDIAGAVICTKTSREGWQKHYRIAYFEI